jgi:hypothetical protein
MPGTEPMSGYASSMIVGLKHGRYRGSSDCCNQAC